jgi:beta-N-acetylhexosaminidase
MAPRLAITLALALAVSLVTVAGPSAEPAARARSGAPEPSTRQLVGQRLVVAIQGLRPSEEILARIRRGEVGGVILFGSNISSPTQVRRLTSDLQGAAREAGRPRLLIATDQEGGSVRRLPWAGPVLPASALGALSAARIRGEGRRAGLALAVAGIDVDLAPVADVPGPGSFMAAEQRTFGTTAARVGAAARAFGLGLADAGVAATVKHFPGIGAATRNTDRSAVEIASTRAQLEAGWAPFAAAIGAGVPLVMISNATYPALDAKPAPWSPAVQALLRGRLGFRGATVTDALDAAAATRGRSVASAAVLSAQAGVDLLLLTGSEASSARVFDHLARVAEQGRIPAASLQRSYDRVLALKHAYR